MSEATATKTRENRLRLGSDLLREIEVLALEVDLKPAELGRLLVWRGLSVLKEDLSGVTNVRAA